MQDDNQQQRLRQAPKYLAVTDVGISYLYIVFAGSAPLSVIIALLVRHARQKSRDLRREPPPIPGQLFDSLLVFYRRPPPVELGYL